MLRTAQLARALLLVHLLSSPVQASEWTEGGIEIGGGYAITAGGAISDEAGGVIVVWEDGRDGPWPNYPDIYAQRWDSSGAALWTDGGEPICTIDASASSSRLVSDGAGGAILVWVDGRLTGSGSGIYAQSVTAAGTPVWADQGVLATSGGPYIGNLHGAPDGLGGVVMVWVDYRAGTDLIYAQRLDSTGTPQWPGDVLVSGIAPGAHYTPEILETLDGGAIVAWVSGSSLNRNVYAQRLSSAGARVWNGGLPVEVCVAPQGQSTPTLVSDGAGGAVIVWEDRRAGADIYAQRVDFDGATQWATDGVPVCEFTADQSIAKTCPDGTGGVIVMWKDERAGTGGEGEPHHGHAGRRMTSPDLYMQRMDGFGIAQWTSGGIPITTAPDVQNPGLLIADGSGGAVVAWTDDDPNGADADVIMQRYDFLGNELWATGGVVQATGPGYRQVLALVAGDAGNTIPVWTTYLDDPGPGAALRASARASGTAISVQKVEHLDGACACEATTSAPGAQGAMSLSMSAMAPNPTTSMAELRVHFERPSDVAVHVYNVRGRRVQFEQLGRREKGWHTLRFDGRDMPSGVYFYSVTAGGERSTKKIVLQR